MVGLSVARIVDCTAIVLLAIRLEAAEHVQIDELAALEGLVWVVGIQDRGFIFPLFFYKDIQKINSGSQTRALLPSPFPVCLPYRPDLEKKCYGDIAGTLPMRLSYCKEMQKVVFLRRILVGRRTPYCKKNFK